jgi:hypothetical protein
MELKPNEWVTVGLPRHEGRAVAIVTKHLDRAAAYLQMATPGTYLVMTDPGHVGDSGRFGGMVWLDHDDPDRLLSDAVVQAFLS